MRIVDVIGGATVEGGSGFLLEAVKEMRHPCLYLEDCIVAFERSTGTIVALDRFDMIVDRAVKVPPDLMNRLIELAIDDTKPYEGVEEFFEVFTVRFVP